MTLSASSHYLNQCWYIVNWTPRNKHQWNVNRNSYIFIQENPFEHVVWKMVAILSRPQCVNGSWWSFKWPAEWFELTQLETYFLFPSILLSSMLESIAGAVMDDYIAKIMANGLLSWYIHVLTTLLFLIPAWQPCPGDRPMYDGADMATSDLPEEHVPPEPQAQPPDVSKLTRIPGYENVGYYANSEYRQSRGLKWTHETCFITPEILVTPIMTLLWHLRLWLLINK